MKSGGVVLPPRTLSPIVKTVPGMVSRMAAVASSLVRSQRAMSPAPTSTWPTTVPVDASTPGPAGRRGPMDRSPVQVTSTAVATMAADTARIARGFSTGTRLHLRRRADTVASRAAQQGSRLVHLGRIRERPPPQQRGCDHQERAPYDGRVIPQGRVPQVHPVERQHEGQQALGIRPFRVDAADERLAVSRI